MYRDDEEAARARRDDLRHELAAVEARLAGLARDVAGAGRLRWQRLALLTLVVALPIGTCIRARFLPPVADDGKVILVVDLPPSDLPYRRPTTGTPEDRCRGADGDACRELAASTRDPHEAYVLFRRACLAGNQRSCLAVGDDLLAGRGVAPDPKTGILLFADSCIAYGDWEACALLRQACAGRSDDVCQLQR